MKTLFNILLPVFLTIQFHTVAYEPVFMTIEGTISPCENVKSVRLILYRDPNEAKELPIPLRNLDGGSVGSRMRGYDAKSGKWFYSTGDGDFRISADVVVELNDGTILEGVDLRPENEDGAKTSDSKDITDDTKAALTRLVLKDKPDTEERRVLRFVVAEKCAVALVESYWPAEKNADKVKWRVDRWNFSQNGKDWSIKDKLPIRALSVKPEDWKALKWLFMPEWGAIGSRSPIQKGVIVQQGNCKIPDKFTPEMGRYPGVEDK